MAPVQRRFQNMCRNKGGVHLKDHEAKNIVGLYRWRFPKIVANWGFASRRILPALQTGRRQKWGPLSVEHQALRLPDGNRLNYRELGQTLVDGRLEWHFKRQGKPQRIYGAKLVENVCQALAFIQIMEAALRVRELTRGLLLPAHQVHDELVYVVDKKLGEMVREVVVQEMERTPLWMPGLPLAAEGKLGPTYGDCK